jgi:hypothetical protein
MAGYHGANHVEPPLANLRTDPDEMQLFLDQIATLTAAMAAATYAPPAGIPGTVFTAPTTAATIAATMATEQELCRIAGHMGPAIMPGAPVSRASIQLKTTNRKPPWRIRWVARRECGARPTVGHLARKEGQPNWFQHKNKYYSINLK